MNLLCDPVAGFEKAKRTFTVLVLLGFGLFASVSVFAVDCRTDVGFPDIGLISQTDVDTFQAVYGPCDTITGSLILFNGSFANLNGLSDIVTITENLEIDVAIVASWAGLSKLETIGGRFDIESALSGSFSSFSGLSSLTSIAELSISNSKHITSLSGMPSLTSLGSLRLSNLRGLASLAGLPAGLNMIESLIISSIDILQSLDGLSPIIGLQELIVQDNLSLTSISALTGSTYGSSTGPPGSPNFFLIITDNPNLAGLDGLPAMPVALRELIINDNSQITNLDELNGLLEVWVGFEISGNPALIDCSSLVKVLDEFDDGDPGPNEDTPDPALFPPDVGGRVYLESNGAGCNSIAEIVGTSSEEGVFMDGFETKITE